MKNAQNTAQILDFSAFRRQRDEQYAQPVEEPLEVEEDPAEAAEATPLIWPVAPMWMWLSPFYALID